MVMLLEQKRLNSANTLLPDNHIDWVTCKSITPLRIFHVVPDEDGMRLLLKGNWFVSKRFEVVNECKLRLIETVGAKTVKSYLLRVPNYPCDDLERDLFHVALMNKSRSQALKEVFKRFYQRDCFDGNPDILRPYFERHLAKMFARLELRTEMMMAEKSK